MHRRRTSAIAITASYCSYRCSHIRSRHHVCTRRHIFFFWIFKVTIQNHSKFVSKHTSLLLNKIRQSQNNTDSYKKMMAFITEEKASS